MFAPRLCSLTFLTAFCVLTACSGGDVKSTLGLQHKAPDEFRVVARPPLSVPPEFDLRPPTPGGQGAASITPTRTQAQSIILRGGAPAGDALTQGTSITAVPAVQVTDPRSAAESAFLDQTGAQKRDVDIRTRLQQEKISRDEDAEEKSWYERWLPRKNASKKEPVVDAKGEAKRIRANKDTGKPVSEGETPVMQKKPSVFENLFK